MWLVVGSESEDIEENTQYSNDLPSPDDCVATHISDRLLQRENRGDLQQAGLELHGRESLGRGCRYDEQKS